MSEYFVVRRGATALRNETVWDERISFGALGILARALATRPGAHLGYRAFTGRGMGEKAVRAALRELEEAGYRHRFTVRADGGRLRTVTVFSDVPISREEALAGVEAEDRARMVGVDAPAQDPEEFEQGSNSNPQDLDPSGHRAADAAARLENRQDHGEKSDVTVPRFTVARSTGARSTVARSTAPRSSAALSLRDTNTSSLRSEVLPDQTGPDPTAEPETARVGVDAGRVRSGPVARGDELDGQATPARGSEGDGASSSGGPARRGTPADSTFRRSSGGGSGVKSQCGRAVPAVSEADRLLVAECLPESMRALDAAGMRRVVGLLEERVEAGWSPAQIRSVMDQPLPPRVGRLASLVAKRLELNVDPMAAPLRAGSLERLSERERHERSRRRSEELAGGAVRRGGDPLMGRALAQVRREAPSAGRAEQARLAAELVRSWRQDAGAGQEVAS